MKYKINYLFKEHEVGVDLWYCKDHLTRTFYKEFYLFIKSHGGEKDLLDNNIHSEDEFIEFALDWNSKGMDNCYGLGFSFQQYFLEVNRGGKLEDQSDKRFIGYCLKNNMFKDFINFLVSFFAWWRNDEHCTSFDPYNYADDFFESSWATLVDTAKLLYFTSETVFWWQSFRVKYAIDNIPGVILSSFVKEEELDQPKTLPRVRVAGYEFLGWFDEEDNEVTIASSNITVYAKLKRKDFYDYWEKEEKTIKKVIDPNVKKVDPL